MDDDRGHVPVMTLCCLVEVVRHELSSRLFGVANQPRLPGETAALEQTCDLWDFAPGLVQHQGLTLVQRVLNGGQIRGWHQQKSVFLNSECFRELAR